MAWTIYRSSDASAPQLNNAAGSLIAVLDAVLVNGYGSKAAAGWTKEYSGTNKAAYKQGTGSSGMLLRVDDSTTVTARVVGYESMTDVDTGTNAFPTAAQVSGGLYIYKSPDSTNRAWWIAADGKRFFMWDASGTTETPETSTAGKNNYFFGDIISLVPSDLYRCAIIANINALATNGVMAAVVAGESVSSGHFICRNHLGAAGAIQFGKFKLWVAGSTTSGGTSQPATYPDPISGGMIVVRTYVVQASGGIRGYIPGIWMTPHSLPANPGDTLTGTGALSGRTLKLMDSLSNGQRGRILVETSDTVET